MMLLMLVMMMVRIVGKKRDLGILDPMIFSGKIRKNTPKIQKNNEKMEKFSEKLEKYSGKLRKILPKNLDPGVKIAFSN